MARILTDETTLTRKRKALDRENQMLRIISYVEAGIAGLLLLAGIVVYLLKGSSALVIVGGAAVFLAFGHFMKIRQNLEEHRTVSYGLKGEVEVTKLLERALGNDTYIMNDVNIKHGRKRAQIDHLIISPKGIFVLETKNWRGALRGDEQERRWEQVRTPGTEPVSVSNPIMQNQRHMEALAGWLKASGIIWPDIHSIVVMNSRNSTWDIQNRTVPILKPALTAEYISYFDPEHPHSEDEITAVINLLMKTQ